jgi:hypothetical protein
MKKRKKAFLAGLILLIALSLGFSISFGAGFDLKQGKAIVKEIAGVKFHTYMAGGMVSNLIETNNYLIMQDTVQNEPHNKELKQFIESLGKPLDRIIISHSHEHHWVGLGMFPGVPVYATAEVIKEIREKGDQMLQDLKKRVGEEAIPYKKVIVPQNVIKPGEETIDGVRFRYTMPDPNVFGNVLFIELPEQRVFLHHHLAYVGMHAPMPPIPPRIEMLEALKDKNYNWIMAGHGIPLGPEFLDKAIEYYNTVLKVVGESPDAKTAKEKMMNAYPTYGGAFLLDAMLPAFYKK